MRVFSCPVCRHPVYFNNLECNCGALLALEPDRGTMNAATASVTCVNREEIGCNWTVDGSQTRCRSCVMTLTRPDPSVPANAALWARAEASKRWVLFNLAGWGWFTPTDSGSAPTFDLLSERTRRDTRVLLWAMRTDIS